ncbi:hypothetical protein GOP47_0002627 [Adiantum capillus-veneris]|uniref:Uncharacterized protein n=1 Tax=Adiantum capillus-veneris TaxID=13818 RepID=A0A9D4ZPC5_ADICA|nr:hypothetical protein GOP47_0002627 [Adiantum capillus-veneris]
MIDVVTKEVELCSYLLFFSILVLMLVAVTPFCGRFSSKPARCLCPDSSLVSSGKRVVSRSAECSFR